MEGPASFLAGPETDHVPLEMRFSCVGEVRAAMGELPVVDVLDLAAFDGEFDPQLR